MARYHRARGNDTFFLTGLDEHGQKIQRIAAERGISEQAYCDEIAAKFQETWRRVEISNDDFIRTTEQRHEDGRRRDVASHEGARRHRVARVRGAVLRRLRGVQGR